MAGAPQRFATVTVASTLRRADVPELFARTCELLADAGEECRLLLCDVAGVAADALAIDALARVALAARRSACEVRLRGASPELLALLALVGLAEALPAEPVDDRSALGRGER